MAFVEYVAERTVSCPAMTISGAARHGLGGGQNLDRGSWAQRLFDGLRGELRALEIERQDRAFLATQHGMSFTADR